MAKISNEKAALAIITAPTLQAAADSLGVHRNTLLRLRKDPEMQAELKRLSREIYEDAINKAMSNGVENIEILQELARGNFSESRSQVAWVQLNAIKAQQEFAKYGADMQDIAKRLERLEELLK